MLVQLLYAFQWHSEQNWFAERRFLREDPLAIGKWVVVFPLLKDRALKLAGLNVSVFERTVDANGDFGAFSDKAHRSPLQSYAEGAKRGVLAVYPTQPKGKSRLNQPVVGFAAYHPRIVGGKVPVAFSVRNKRQPNSIVVSAKG